MLIKFRFNLIAGKSYSTKPVGTPYLTRWDTCPNGFSTIRKALFFVCKTRDFSRARNKKVVKIGNIFVFSGDLQYLRRLKRNGQDRPDGELRHD